MDSNNRTSPAVMSPPPDHPMTQANLNQYFYESLLDRVKTGTALLFCGIFLALVGVTFTAMGWLRYRLSTTMEWPQMLGPVLISLGGAFVLTSIFRYGMVSCWSCRQWDPDVLDGPRMEEPSGGPAVTMTRPVMTHSGPVVCFPPLYNFIVEQDSQAHELQSGGLTHLPPPAFYSLDNFTLVAEEGGSGLRRSRSEERRRDASGGRPPAYDDIYPTSETHRHALD
ncbi:transmembrane protein 174 [Neosynchiropus ocellatus]